MQIFKKNSFKLSFLLMAIICLFNSSVISAKAASDETPNEFFYEVSIDELEIGEPVTTYHNLDTGLKIEIELIEKEEVSNEYSTYGYGNSGWSGGTIPAKATMMVRATVDGISFTKLEYKVDTIGLTITSAYALAYSLNLYTMQSTSLNITNPTATSSAYARTELTYTAVLIEYGVVVNSYGGFLNFEIDSSGHVRTSWFI